MAVTVGVVGLCALVAGSWLLLWQHVVVLVLRLFLSTIADARLLKVECERASAVWPKSFRISGLSLKPWLVRLVDAGFADLEVLYVESIHVRVPTSSSLVFGLSVGGIFVQIRQREFPKPKRGFAAEVLLKPDGAHSTPQKTKALEVVEGILWGSLGRELSEWSSANGTAPKSKGKAGERGGVKSNGTSLVSGYLEQFLKRIMLRLSDISVLILQDRHAMHIAVRDAYVEGRLYGGSHEGTTALPQKYPKDDAACSLGVSCITIKMVLSEAAQGDGDGDGDGEGGRFRSLSDCGGAESYIIRQWSITMAVSLAHQRLSMDVQFKALKVHLHHRTMMQVADFLSKLQHYMNHQDVWEHRPQQPMCGHAQAYWHYAARAVLKECRKYSHVSSALEHVALRRMKRIEYQSVYRMKHARFWNGVNGSKNVDRLLRDMERRLTFEEVVHFRSSFMLSRCRKKKGVLDKIGLVDAIVNDITFASSCDYASKREDGAGSLVLEAISFEFPKLSVAIQSASSTTTAELAHMEMAYDRGNAHIRCDTVCIRNDALHKPLLVVQPMADTCPFLSVDCRPEAYHVDVAFLKVCLDRAWLVELLYLGDAVTNASCHFADLGLNIQSLVQSTYSVNPAKPPMMSTVSTPLVVNAKGLSIMVPVASSDADERDTKYVAMVMRGVVLDMAQRERGLKSKLRAAILHPRQRALFQSVVPASLDEMSIHAAIKLSIGSDPALHANRQDLDILDVNLLSVNMQTENSLLPKCFNSSLTSFKVVMPAVSLYVSASRLQMVSESVNTLMLGMAATRAHATDPACEGAPVSFPQAASMAAAVETVGMSDSLSDYFVHCRKVAVHFIQEGEEGAETHPLMKLKLTNFKTRYTEDCHNDIKCCKFGLGRVTTEVLMQERSYHIIRPMYITSIPPTQPQTKGTKRKKSHWGTLREKLSITYVLDFFPSWVSNQIYGTLTMSGPNTGASVHIASLNVLIDSKVYKPLLQYMLSLQDSLAVSGDGEDDHSNDRRAPAEESEHAAKPPVHKESSLSVDFVITNVSLQIAEADDPVASMDFLNGQLYHQASTDRFGASLQETHFMVQSITALDLKYGNQEIMHVRPFQENEHENGIVGKKVVRGTVDSTQVSVSDIHVLFIHRFVQDVLFCVSSITEALPKAEETTEGAAEPPKPAEKTTTSTTAHTTLLNVSMGNIELVLPVRSTTLDQTFTLLMSMKIDMGNAIACPLPHVAEDPSLQVSIPNFTFDFADASAGSQRVIPVTKFLCYMETVVDDTASPHSRICMLCEELCLNLSQLVYGNLMDFLSRNLAEGTRFVHKEEPAPVVRHKRDFVGKAFSYQDALDFPVEESPTFEFCISSSEWKFNFMGTDARTQYAQFMLTRLSFTFRVMASGNTHMGMKSSSFSLEDCHSAHARTKVFKGDPQILGMGNFKVESNPALKMMFVITKEGVTAIELEFYNFVVTWPYMADTSLLNNCLSVLATNEPNDDEKRTERMVSPEVKKWFYFNFIARKSDIIIPLKEAISKPTSSEGDDQDTLAGLQTSLDVLRFRYACGGDGSSRILANMYGVQMAFQSSQSHRRDPFIPPFNMEVTFSQDVPSFVEECERLKKYLVVLHIQRAWRSRHRKDSPANLRKAMKPLAQLNSTKAFILEYGMSPSEREPNLQNIKVAIDDVKLKASFSEIHLWRTLLKAFEASPKENKDGEESSSEMAPDPVAAPVFRPAVMEVDLMLSSFSFVVCDDRQRTYGNPDVLRMLANCLTLKYKMDTQEEEKYTKTNIDLNAKLSAQFLDNSLSRYSTFLHPWSLGIEYQIEDDAFGGKSDSIYVNSEERMDIHVSPHLLLALGDVMTFSKLLGEEQQADSGSSRALTPHRDTGVIIDPEEGDSDMAPQKYCLNNYTGFALWYWGPPQSTAHRVSDGQRVIVEVQTQMTESKISTVQAEGHESTSTIQFECLHLQFEGNWSPLRNVNVSLVGKYKYRLQSPLEGAEVPVIVDIVLVGRTKVISVHSQYWIFNRTDRPLTFRLQQNVGFLNAPTSVQPIASTTSPLSARARKPEMSSDVVIGPVEPASGFYLPVTAAIRNEALLYVQAQGLEEATKHQIHLTDVDTIQFQQQVIECNPFNLITAASDDRLPVSCIGEASMEGTPMERCEEGAEADSPVRPMADLDDADGQSPSIQSPSPSMSRSPNAHAEDQKSFFANLRIMNTPCQQVHLPSYVMDSTGLMCAPKPIESEFSFQPPIVVNNALPYEIEVSLSDSTYATRSAGNVNRVTSMGSILALDSAQMTSRRLSESSTGIILHPGNKADIYCDLNLKQKLTIKVKTAAQGSLTCQSPVLIHDGSVINKEKVDLPGTVTMIPLHSGSQTASERPRNLPSELELTQRSIQPIPEAEGERAEGQDPPEPEADVPLESDVNSFSIEGMSDDIAYNPNEKAKLVLGVDNVPTGEIGREVTLYCPFWIDNQTTVDILMSEKDALPSFGRSRGKDEILVPARATEGDASLLSQPVLFSTNLHHAFFRLAAGYQTKYTPSINIKRVGPSHYNPIPLSEGPRKRRTASHRLYHLSVDVLPCPPDTIYNKTKVISIKTAIIIENTSSFNVIYRQSGIEDGVSNHTIKAGESCDHSWDSSMQPMEITMRPCGEMWNWSSTFPLLCKGDMYFGLRLSHQEQRNVYLIIPISVTVSATHILVSFKDPSAEPPYRIQNDCLDVKVTFQQGENQRLLTTLGESLRDEEPDPVTPQTTVLPGTSVGYAWDVPTFVKKLVVNVCKVESGGASSTAEYSIEDLGDRSPIILSEIRRSASRNPLLSTPSFGGSRSYSTGGSSAPSNHLERKLKAVLAKELALKVFVSVYADGPTRVLRFSDKKDTSTIQAELSMLEMHTRLKRLEDDLQNNVNRKFASLDGRMKNRPISIDLYGRNKGYHGSDPNLRSSSRLATPQVRKTPGRKKRPDTRDDKLKGKRRKEKGRGKGKKEPKGMTQDILLNEMKDSMEDESNTILSLGGELTVTVHKAHNLLGNPQNTHSYAELELDGEIQKTNIELQNCNPVWNENFVFHNTRATSFLDVRIVGVNAQSWIPGSKNAARSFLGCVRIPLLETFTMESSESLTYTLGNRNGRESVGGEIVISISWKTSASSLMQMKVDTFEKILAQRMEILAKLNPLSSKEWEERVSNTRRREALVHHIGFQKGDLMITVLAAQNLKKRGSFQPLATLDFTWEAPLCNAFVSVSCSESKEESTFSTNVVTQSLEPVFDEDSKFTFSEVPLAACVKFDLYDKSPIGRAELLGSRTVQCSEISTSISTPFNPVYAWINLDRQNKKKGASHTDDDAQIFVRMQWCPLQKAMKSTTSIYVNLSGIGIALISGGMGGEIVNMTLDGISIRRVQDDREKDVSGVVKRVQIDNQLSNAAQPVVLQTLGTKNEQGKNDFLNFSFVEVFSAKKGKANIRSIKDFQLFLGDLKLEVDDLFMDAVLRFVQALPMGDLWQDDNWEATLNCMLDFNLPFGPPEINDLSGIAQEDNSYLDGCLDPIEWYHNKAADQMESIRALSSSSSWYFIEKAQIGTLRISMSLSISSKILPGSDGSGKQKKSLVNRSLNTSGLQLIDVDNAPLEIKGLTFAEEVVGVNALKERLTQHLQWQFISEAHKVLGGSGPAFAGVFMSFAWGVSSTYTVGRDMTEGRMGPKEAAQQMGFIVFATASQALGAMSTTCILVLAVIPSDADHGDWSDAKTLKRYSRKPINAPNAMYTAGKEVVRGTVRALSGFLTDPVWAIQKGGILWLPLGLVKGFMGIPIRLVGGGLEFFSRFSMGLGQLCLGKEGIEGALPHRIRAPIVFQEQAQLKSLAEIEHAETLQKWRDVLFKLLPSMRNDAVVHFVELSQGTRKRKETLLFSHNKIVLVGSVDKKGRLKYSVRWILTNAAIKQMIGKEDKLTIKLKYIITFQTACCGEWAFPNTRIITCATQDIFRQARAVINMHRGEVADREEARDFTVSRAADLELIPRSYYLR